MTKQRLRSWRLFTITVAVLTSLLGYLGGVATSNISHSMSWKQGYDAAMSEVQTWAR